MSCEECQRLRNLQERRHRSCLEHIGNNPRQTTKTPIDPERELKDAYDAAAAEYRTTLPRRSSYGLGFRRQCSSEAPLTYSLTHTLSISARS